MQPIDTPTDQHRQPVDLSAMSAPCASCDRPAAEHCKRHVIPCCPGRCPYDDMTSGKTLGSAFADAFEEIAHIADPDRWRGAGADHLEASLIRIAELSQQEASSDA